jgi:tol-pal system protein YbgF
MLHRLAVLAFLIFTVPASAQDAADLIVRMNRLENQVRTLSGQIEQLQFENRQLRDQVRKFQEDVEFRFQERGGAPRMAAPPATPGGGATPSRTASPPAAAGRRSDAFDPAQNPDAPGSPRGLGTTQPSAPLGTPPATAGAPMPLPGGSLAGINDLIAQDEESPGSAPLDLGQTGRAAAVAPPVQQRTGPSVAAAGSSDPRADYDAAYAYLLQKQYEQAEMGFRRFLQSHPRDRLVPDATYWLGESYLQRNRHREAAEQFLNVSTEHPKAAKAPDALLKLGISLNALGVRDRACAVFAELDRKYPQALPSTREASGREQKRAKCV